MSRVGPVTRHRSGVWFINRNITHSFHLRKYSIQIRNVLIPPNRRNHMERVLSSPATPSLVSCGITRPPPSSHSGAPPTLSLPLKCVVGPLPPTQACRWPSPSLFVAPPALSLPLCRVAGSLPLERNFCYSIFHSMLPNQTLERNHLIPLFCSYQTQEQNRPVPLEWNHSIPRQLVLQPNTP